MDRDIRSESEPGKTQDRNPGRWPRPAGRNCRRWGADHVHWRDEPIADDWWSNHLDRGDETIAAPRQRFDEARSSSGITQGLAQSLDDGVEAMLEVDVDVVTPELLAHLDARNQDTRLTRQRRKDTKGLLCEQLSRAVQRQFPGLQIQLEIAESNDV